MRSWSTFSAHTSHEQTQTHKTHHGPNSKETTTFPHIVLFMANHGAYTQMLFCPKTPNVITLTLGLRLRYGLTTKVRAYDGATKNETWESHFMLLGVRESVKEWTSTFPSELPLWELEFWWISKFLESDYMGQNPLDWRVPYIIRKLLERRCPKWVPMTHLGT
jgi:hypothetical protein